MAKSRRKRRLRGLKWGWLVPLLLVAAACGGSSTPSSQASPSATPTEVAVVGHWVGSCTFTGKAIPTEQLSLDLTADGTYYATSEILIVGSYALPTPGHLLLTNTRNGATTTTDYTIVAVTGSRLQITNQGNDVRRDCSFVKAGPPQTPSGSTSSGSASSPPGGGSETSQPAPGATESTAGSAQSLVGPTWRVVTLSSESGCFPPFGLSAVEESIGTTRRTFTFQPDGTITGNDLTSPPDPENSSGAFTLTYTLSGSSLTTSDSYSSESWTVVNVTDNSFGLVRTSGEGGQKCEFTRDG